MLMPEHIAGRDAELEAVGDFLAQISQGAAAHVLEGEAGMGKTTLWRAAIEQAEVAGVLVLQAQPVESETTLSYATSRSRPSRRCSGERFRARLSSARRTTCRSTRGRFESPS